MFRIEEFFQKQETASERSDTAIENSAGLDEVA
jgi:hypothetical protein